MPDIFQAIKDNVSLAEHMKHARGGTLANSGNTQRINPCPHCGHKDCCTIYKDNTYSCFSCDVGGDVVNFERHVNNHPDNISAAKALAKEYNLTYDDGGNKKAAPKKSAPAEKKPDPGQENPPKIPINRAREIRAAAAELYHQELLSNLKAVDYQIKKRGHTLDVIRKYKIGLGSEGVTQKLIDAGYTKEDLYAVSLLNKSRRGYFRSIPPKIFVYPHYHGDDILHFTIKDPRKEHAFQLKRYGADPDWICYGQDNLKQAEIWMTEGENDRISLVEKGGIKNVIAIIGNSNTPNILQWLAKNAKGKTFYLCFDPDDAGEKYTKKYAPAIANAGGTAYIVSLAPLKNGDIDDILRDAGDPKAAIADIKKNHTKPFRISYGGDDDGDNESMDYDFGAFDVLGELANGSIAFWSNVFRRLYRVPLKELSLDQLCQIGGEEVRARVSRTLVEGMVQFKSLKTHLIVKAAHNYLGNLTSLGQGVHLLRDNNIIIVNGDEATIWDGQKFTRQTHPILDRQFLYWDSNLSWINTEALEAAVLEMDHKKAFEIMSNLLGLVGQWRFAGTQDMFLMTGWFLAQIVQAAWVWRPQLWLSGTSGSGKSRLTLLLEALAGDLACRYEGNALTEAGLRQTLQSHTYMITIDEFEESPHRDKIIERLRSAGHGGKGAIGSTSQEAVVYNLRHMIMLASIETGLIRAAEQYRYLQVSTVKDNSRQPTIPSQAECERLQLDLVAYAIWAVNRAKKMIKHLKPIQGYDNRWIASVAVPMAMIATSGEDETEATESLHSLMGAYISEWDQRQAGGDLTDETALVEDVLTSKLRVAEDQETDQDIRTVYVERTVSQLLAFHPLPPDYDQTLQAHGIRLITPDYSLFVNPDVVSRQLLRNTRWKNLNIRDILARSQGAMRSRCYIAGTQVRGIMIPVETWRPAEDEE